MTISLINRNPEPNETDIPISTDIAVDIADNAGTGIDTAATEVRVNGVLAYDGDGGGFQTGFTGPNSATSNPDADTLRVVIDPTSDFTSEQTVTIRVVSNITGGGSAIDVSYTFTTEDLTTPEVAAATALSKSVVRVSFNEDVNMDDATASNDALNPANYVFTRQSKPAANVVASSVVAFSSTAVDVTLDIEMTPSATYEVAVSSVEDPSGNIISPPDNTANFTGFVPARPAGRDFQMFFMLPSINRREDTTRHLEFTIATLQESLDLVLCSVDEWTKIIDIDLAPERFVDAILQDLGNPFRFDLTEIDKRRLAVELVRAYKQKGTCVGIINLVRFFLGLEIDCVPFNQLPDQWIIGVSELGVDSTLGPSAQSGLYSFELVSTVALTQDQRDRIFEICEFMKPAHTHCVRLVEPDTTTINHLVLGVSQLGVNWLLH